MFVLPASPIRFLGREVGVILEVGIVLCPNDTKHLFFSQRRFISKINPYWRVRRIITKHHSAAIWQHVLTPAIGMIKCY